MQAKSIRLEIINTDSADTVIRARLKHPNWSSTSRRTTSSARTQYVAKSIPSSLTKMAKCTLSAMAVKIAVCSWTSSWTPPVHSVMVLMWLAWNPQKYAHSKGKRSNVSLLVASSIQSLTIQEILTTGATGNTELLETAKTRTTVFQLSTNTSSIWRTSKTSPSKKSSPAKAIQLPC